MKRQKLYQEMRKTKHAIDRQFDRDVDDFLLEKIGWKIDFYNKGKNVYIVKSETLKKCGYNGIRKFLVLVMKYNRLITLYFTDNLLSINVGKAKANLV